MLTEIQIDNLGVIEHLHLSLHDGFTAFTGETGAGKTMLIEAISLLVGGRADASMVRAGAAEARVEGRFVKSVVGASPDEEFVLSRIVPVDGRSRAYINGRMATVSGLADIGVELVDIHGQHDHQRLLTPAAQRLALDSFGNIDTDSLRRAREAVTEIDAAMATLGGDERARAREIDLLRYQCDEIEAAHLSNPDEDDTLREEQDRLSDIGNYRESLGRLVATFDDEGGVLERLGEVRNRLNQLSNLGEAAQRISAAVAEVNDVAAELRSLVEAAEENPERLEWVISRRQLLKDIMRKYGSSLREVLEFGDASSKRLQELESYEERVKELETDKQVALEHLRDVASTVAQHRRRSAPLLAAEVERRLHRLAMDHAALSVEIVASGDEIDPGDNVVFMLSANPGSPLLPLNKVASGGELARTMLALRLTLSEEPGTMVFDEVDAGIGGEAAIAVAQSLAELGEKHQVFVVTHLPQVAAAAANHVGVHKRVEDGATFGSAHPLDDEERIAEVARMLSGGLADDAARQHAAEMIRTFSVSRRH